MSGCGMSEKPLTESDRICILFLSNKMEATARMVGREIYDKRSSGRGSNLNGLGASTLGRLRRRGLVMRLPELRAWRLTMEGRALLPKVRTEYMAEASVSLISGAHNDERH